jgi:hypothetical protein
MPDSAKPATHPGRSAADEILIDLLLKHACLMELQIQDLKGQVRQFVDQMNVAIMKLDSSVTEEGLQANQLYESVYEESQQESKLMNERAAARVDDLLAEALKEAGMDSPVSADLLASLNSKSETDDHNGIQDKEAHDEVWSKISKKLESVTRLEERLRPHVFKIIECLNFEDIQSQKLEHLVFGYKLLNTHTSRYLASSQGMDDAALRAFANDFLMQVRKSYSTEEERHIFDQVFKSKKN